MLLIATAIALCAKAGFDEVTAAESIALLYAEPAATVPDRQSSATTQPQVAAPDDRRTITATADPFAGQVIAVAQAISRSPYARIATAPIDQMQSIGSRYEYARVLMGTRCRVLVQTTRSEPEAAAAVHRAFERIAAIEQVLSDYRDDSEASRVMRNPPLAWHEVSPMLADAIEKSRRVHDASGGAFDITLGPLTRRWRVSVRTGALPDVQDLARALRISRLPLLAVHPADADPPPGMRGITADHAEGAANTNIDEDGNPGTPLHFVRFAVPGMRLDFGGIGKGLGADAAAASLRADGIDRFLIDFGGDLLAGAPPCVGCETGADEANGSTAGLPDPAVPGWRIQVNDGIGRTRSVNIADAAIATSGDLEQFVVIDGVRYSHVIDSSTGLGLTRRTAATVIAEAAWLADALASAACVIGPDQARLMLLASAFPDAVQRIEVWWIDEEAREDHDQANRSGVALTVGTTEGWPGEQPGGHAVRSLILEMAPDGPEIVAD